MNEINVIYQFNEKYVPYAGVSMTSLLVNNSDVEILNIYVLGEGITGKSRELLEQTVSKYGKRIHFPETSDLIEKFKDMGMIPYRGAYSVYLRLFFTEIINLSGKKAVYLDSDTIVDGSLLPLVNYDLKGKSTGMVLESIRDNYKIMIGMKPDSEYYNSGVILFDVDKWTENRYCDRIVDHIRSVRNSYIGDQDFLNIVCEGDVCRLSLTYNFQPLHGRYTVKEYLRAYRFGEYYSVDEINDANNNAVIYHCYRWLGEFPWNKGNLHPFSDKFDKYLELSLWSGCSKEKANIGMILQIEKLLYRLMPKSVFIKVFKIAHEIMLRRAERDALHNLTNDKA